MLSVQLKNEDGRYPNRTSRHDPAPDLRLVSQAEIKQLVEVQELSRCCLKQDFQCFTLIQRALKYENTHSLYDVLNDLRAGKAQLWVAGYGNTIDGICVTCINNYPNTTICLIWLCAGIGREKYTRLIGNIEQWAKAQGCESISLEGRPGWERVLTDYKKTKIMLEKVI